MPIEVLPQYEGFFQDARYKIALSGRGSGKSVGAGIALMYFASHATIKILCLREFQSSVAESSKAQLENIITMSGTQDAWDITEKYIRHKVTGSRFVFRGMNKMARSLKSYTDFDVAWIEEAEDISQESWDLLIPTIRKPDSEIWACYNPKLRTSIMAQTFIENDPPPNTIIMRASYLENPYLDQEQIVQANHMAQTNPTLFKHIWLGEYLDTSITSLVNNVKIGDDSIAYPDDPVIVGVDIAMEGGDRTCFCIRKGRKILDLMSFEVMDRETLVHELKIISVKYKPSRINVDSTGHGAWVPQMLEGSGILVHGVNFSENAIKDDKYHNRRTELCGEATEFFKQGGMIPSRFGELALEIEASHYTIDNKSRFQLLPKLKTKKQIGKSPDLADAFYLSLYDPHGMFATKTMLDNAKIVPKLATKQLIQASKWGRK